VRPSSSGLVAQSYCRQASNTGRQYMRQCHNWADSSRCLVHPVTAGCCHMMPAPSAARCPLPAGLPAHPLYCSQPPSLHLVLQHGLHADQRFRYNALNAAPQRFPVVPSAANVVSKGSQGPLAARPCGLRIPAGSRTAGQRSAALRRVGSWRKPSEDPCHAHQAAMVTARSSCRLPAGQCCFQPHGAHVLNTNAVLLLLTA
jgi:hypothetical protein